MKRIDALIPFSHDHQHGLAHALRLRRAADAGDVDAFQQTITEFLAFARDELAPHMRAEEETLLPVVFEHGIASDEQLLRVAREHAALRAHVAALTDAPDDRERAGAAAALLHDHIRWEERELFEAWQRALAARDEQLELPSHT